jgi:hypothetical protein
MRSVNQGNLQNLVTVAGPTGGTLPHTMIIPRGDTHAGSQMVCSQEAAPSASNLRDNFNAVGYSGNGVQQIHCLFKRIAGLLDLCIEACNGFALLVDLTKQFRSQLYPKSSIWSVQFWRRC